MKNTLRHTAALFTLAAIPVASDWPGCGPSTTGITASAQPPAAERTVEPSRGGSIGGSWEQRLPGAPGEPERLIRFTARGTAPVSEAEFVQGGRLVGRITTEWSQDGSAWTARRRIIALYREGVKARTLELPFERPMSVGGANALAVTAPSLPVATPAGSASLDESGGGDSCDAQFDAMFDAMDGYWAADAWLSSCGCVSAAVAVIWEWNAVSRASSRLDACLAVS